MFQNIEASSQTEWCTKGGGPDSAACGRGHDTPRSLPVLSIGTEGYDCDPFHDDCVTAAAARQRCWTSSTQASSGRSPR